MDRVPLSVRDTNLDSQSRSRRVLNEPNPQIVNPNFGEAGIKGDFDPEVDHFTAPNGSFGGTPQSLSSNNTLSKSPPSGPGAPQWPWSVPPSHPTPNVHPLFSDPPSTRQGWPSTWEGRSFSNGRVLAINYFWNESTKRVIVRYQEICSPKELETFLHNPTDERPTLRLLCPSNAPWAYEHLDQKLKMNAKNQHGFPISQLSDPSHKDCGKVQLDGSIFKPTNDRHRGVVQGGFGFDYLQLHPHRWDIANARANQELTWDTWTSWGRAVAKRELGNPTFPHSKLMELSSKNAEGNARVFRDAFVHRLIALVQLRHEDLRMPKFKAIPNPYQIEYTDYVSEGDLEAIAKECPRLEDSLENLIVLIDTSIVNTVPLSGTLVPFREVVESVWIDRLGQLDLRKFSSKRDFLLTVTDITLQGSFIGLQTRWSQFLDHCEHHMAILRDGLYSQPEEISRAGELWNNELYWTLINRLDYIERLATGHAELVEEVMTMLANTTGKPCDEWLTGTKEAIAKVRTRIDFTLSNPMFSMNDLVTKLIQNRDAAVSVQLSDSMWWLSWITFIFLPLTFISGAFGMNINWLENNPDGSFYFAIAVPFVVILITVWYTFKDVLFPDDRLAAAQRSEFERLFRELRNKYPGFWTVKGPGLGFQMGSGPMGKVKLWLLWFWYAPHKTVDAPLYGQTKIKVDWWSRVKCKVLEWVVPRVREQRTKGSMVDI